MIRYIALIMLTLLIPMFVGAENLSWNFTPTSVEVNNLNTASFDPVEPWSQPDLTQLTITNQSTLESYALDLKMGVYWNDRKLVEANYQTKPGVQLLPGAQFHLGNRDLITNIDNVYFQKKPEEPELSVDSAINSNSTLKSAVLAGFFPDGDLQLRVWVRQSPVPDDPWQEPGTDYQAFTIMIRNAGVINLLSPGEPIGQNPPILSNAPLSFLWNSVFTGFNPQTLTIREYPPTFPPQSGNIANTGSLFFQKPDCFSGFADFLPFIPGNYYAWQVSTPLTNEYSNPNSTTTSTFALKSNWFVFRYANEPEDGSSVAEFQARLNNLQNNDLRNIQVEGYVPVGVVVIDGITYSGNEALKLIDSLIGQDIKVLLKD
ncbi:MAG: hypothetical protein PHO32_03890 [Candidatus Cloacimonetes bacterium]|nr:hypothetical protein [Candidatus Cloacimonadota bacterium]